MLDYLKDLWTKFSTWATDTATLIGLMRVILGILFIIIGCKIVKGIAGRITRSKGMKKTTPSFRSFMKHVLAVLLYVAVVLLGAMIIGLDLTIFGALLASIGVTIGLALQGGLSNIAGGLMIVGLKPFEVGDYIESCGTAGTVVDIGLFYTTLTTVDNKKVVIPNSKVTGDVVTDFSSHDTRRVDLNFVISYDSDLELAKKVLCDYAAQNERVLKEPAPVVYVTKHGDKGLEIVFRTWVNTPDYWDVYFDLSENAKRVFNENGIVVPYPQFDVNLKK